MDVRTRTIETGETAGLRSDEVSYTLNRTAWGAIWAGFFVTLGVEAVLTLLMMGIFASFVHPGGTPSGMSFGIGIAIWFFLQTLGAYYCGGWVAGRLARKPDGGWNSIHSFAVWGITTAVLVYLLASAAGVSANATLDLLRTGLGMTPSMQGVGSATAQLGNAAKAAGQTTAAVATWIPIFLFITFGCSLGTALAGGYVGTPGRRSEHGAA